MKKYFLLLSAILAINAYATDTKTEFKLRDIAKPSVLTLSFRIPWICAFSWESVQGLGNLFIHRDNHGDLHYDDKIIYGPDSVFLYMAMHYPALLRFLTKIFAAYTASTKINGPKLEQFLKAKEEGTGILTYGDDIDVPLRLIASLEKQGWADSRLKDSFGELTIKIHNKSDVINAFKDYLEERADSLSPEVEKMFKKKVYPEDYVPKGYKWKFEQVN